MTEQGPGIETRKNGHVVLTLDSGMVIELRRPKLGEYKAIRTGILDSAEAIKGLGPDQDKEIASMDGMVSFWRHVLETVGIRGELPEDPDDFDFWLLMQQTQTELFKAWQTVPLVHGQ